MAGGGELASIRPRTQVIQGRLNSSDRPAEVLSLIVVAQEPHHPAALVLGVDDDEPLGQEMLNVEDVLLWQVGRPPMEEDHNRR